MKFAPSYMIKVVFPVQTDIVHTADVATLMGKSKRTVRRYAQYGQVRTIAKTHKKGWHYVQQTKVTIG